MRTDPGNIQIAHRYTNVEFGTEVELFLFWEYIIRIFVAVGDMHPPPLNHGQKYLPVSLPIFDSHFSVDKLLARKV
jgi:hypothetical protein